MIAELGPPKGANPKVVRGKAEILRKCADAVNITDNQTAIVRMSSIASAVILNQMEIEPVILDLLMSGMDGFEVIKKLKEDPELSKIPILILTSVKKQASERRYELETGLSLDVDDYVEKPVNPKDFLHRIEKILERY